MSLPSSAEFPIKQLFPLGKQGVPLLHALIANGQCPSEQLSKWAIKNPVSIHEQDPITGVTALGVAVMAKNANLVYELLSKYRINPLPLDKMGWTPLHYAILLEDQVLQKLLTSAITTNDLAVPKLTELHTILNPAFPRPKDPVAKREDGTYLTAGQFKQLFHIDQYSSEAIATPRDLIKYWEIGIPPSLIEQRQTYYTQKIQTYRQRPTELLLSEKDEVIAGQDFKPGQVIGIHGGELTPFTKKELEQLPREKASYRFHQLDAEKVTNLATLVTMQYGFPNCFLQTVNIEGIPCSFLLSLHSIKKGEIIRIDPGGLEFFEKHKFSSLTEDLIEFCKKNSIRRIYRDLEIACSYNTDSAESTFAIEGLRSRFRYLFTTPSVLIQLVLEEIMTPQEIMGVATQSMFLSLTELSSVELHVILSLIQDLATIYPYVKESPSPKKKMLKGMIMKFLRQYEFRIVFHFLNGLADRLSNPNNQSISPDQLIEWSNIFQQNAKAEKILIQWLQGKVSSQEAEKAIQEIHFTDWIYVIRDIPQYFPPSFAKNLTFCRMAATVHFKQWAEEKKNNLLSALALLYPYPTSFKKFVDDRTKLLEQNRQTHLKDLEKLFSATKNNEEIPQEPPTELHLLFDPEKLQEITAMTQQAKEEIADSEKFALFENWMKKKTTAPQLIAVLRKLAPEELEKFREEAQQLILAYCERRMKLWNEFIEGAKTLYRAEKEKKLALKPSPSIEEDDKGKY